MDEQPSAANPTDLSTRRVAIATMWHFANPSNFSKGSCGLLKWCFSASRLAALPYMREQRTDVLVVTNDATFVELECGMPASTDVVAPRTIALDPSVQQLVRQWSAARCKQGKCSRGRGGMSNAAHAGLLRLQFFGMVQYSAVLVTDLDVDFFLMRQGIPPRPDSGGGVLSNPNANANANANASANPNPSPNLNPNPNLNQVGGLSSRGRAISATSLSRRSF